MTVGAPPRAAAPSLEPDAGRGDNGTMRYVNLGCGRRYDADWINFDIAPVAPGIIRCDLSREIPLPDASCDVVYHSHVLEHIRRDDVPAFLRECRRVLKPGGVLRIATPDLETICRTYIRKLDSALDGDERDTEDCEWMRIELLDQLVRERRGGAMREYVTRKDLENAGFIYERIGDEARHIRSARPAGSPHSRRSLPARVRARIGRASRVARSRLIRWLAGPDALHALEIGRFRLAGEVHHWLYDRVSLAALLVGAGFVEPVVQSASASRISEWPRFRLDTRADGTPVKPDSLFMEAIVPAPIARHDPVTLPRVALHGSATRSPRRRRQPD